MIKYRRSVETSDKQEKHLYPQKKQRIYIPVLLGILLLLIFIGISTGPFTITIEESFKAVIQGITGIDTGIDTVKVQIVMNLRIPRILWAVVAGMGFGFTGALIQTVLRNPLASPFTLGISSGANFGVAVSVVLGFNYNMQLYGIIGNAFLFSILTSLLIMGISSLKGGTVQIIILAGIALSYILRAGGSLLEYLANPEQLEVTRAFSRGELGSFGYSELLIVCSVMLVSFLLVLPRVMDLNVMVFGDEKAKTLGVKSSGLRMFIMLISSLLIASIVAFVGPIGFVGLAGPHISRSLVGINHKIFLPASALVGAVILLGADLIGMNLIPGIIIPVGVMTAFIGVPFFLYFIIKERRKFW